MDYESVKKYLLSKPEAVEDYPFGPQAVVIKVKQKMFALMSRRNGLDQVNLKCDPYRAAALRDVYEAVIPGYHMNKLHWNTVILDGSIAEEEVIKMIDHSYALVVNGLKKIEKNVVKSICELDIKKTLSLAKEHKLNICGLNSMIVLMYILKDMKGKELKGKILSNYTKADVTKNYDDFINYFSIEFS